MKDNVARMMQVTRGLTVAAGMISAAFKHQMKKFGTQHLPDLDPVLSSRKGGATPQQFAKELEIPTAARAKQNCEVVTSRGEKNWGVILVEEVAEAIEQAALKNLDELQEELAQIAAVCVGWIDDIHSRRALTPGV